MRALRAHTHSLTHIIATFFLGSSGYKLVAEVTSFPRIKLFGITWYESIDEHAEETWTVFDHPVIRIYKKI
ncbi:MAG: hypothetical protein UZ22_OP11002001073 [Microgenomates bacterium OLB23]|nr:MAG: hypothetical protein UZ22_OP11002001073 [Microgenomates bacterium OLB23]